MSWQFMLDELNREKDPLMAGLVISLAILSGLLWGILRWTRR